MHHSFFDGVYFVLVCGLVTATEIPGCERKAVDGLDDGVEIGF